MAIDDRIEQDAQGILRETWAVDLESCPLPIDPIAIAKQLGVTTFTAAIPDSDVSGMLVKRAGQDPMIYLNSRDHPNRQRFTCAHEVGHYVRRAGTDGEDWEYIDRRSSLSRAGTDAEEMYANQFAAALLMPEPRVRSLVQGGLSKATMALRFEVSVDAMGYRLANLGITA